MKKMLFAAIVAGLMSTSAMATTGKIGQVKVEGNNDRVLFTLIKDSDSSETGFSIIVGASPEIIKSLTATVLTAKSANLDVDAHIRTVNEVKGWGIVILK